jgi:hypothetical protein
MLKTERRTINEVAYETTTLPARKAVRLGTRVLALVLPAFGELGDGVEDLQSLSKLAEAKMQAGFIGRAAGALVTQLHREDVVELILGILASTTRIDPDRNERQAVGEGAIFDDVYAGNLGELVGAVRFALEVNLGNFFAASGIGGILQRAGTTAQVLTEDSSGSTPTQS